MISIFDLSNTILEQLASDCYDWTSDLLPLNRSITGDGLRETLKYFKNIVPEMSLNQIPSGTPVFDWYIPKEWIIRDAYIMDSSKNKIIDISVSNLHVLNYSAPISEKVTLDVLLKHVYTLPEQPNAIPYVTSYYKRRWGFCMTQEQLNSLKDDYYYVHIDSSFVDGSLNYGEIFLPATLSNTAEEIFISSYVCHPSMANNELSGPCLATALARYLKSLDYRRYNYRFIFIPETIGSIAYLSLNHVDMKANISAGFNLTCVGDNRCFSYLPSRNGNSLSDKALKLVLSSFAPDFTTYSWLDRGSDERQYCSPGIDLPVASFMRSKYGTYPEYHTSLDTLDGVVTREGFLGSITVMLQVFELLENNYIFNPKVLCEPQLSSKGLYPDLSIKSTFADSGKFLDILTYCDGFNSLMDICNTLSVSPHSIMPLIDVLLEFNLISY